MQYPSTEFNDALADLCHGVATDTAVVEVHRLLQADTAARDEYLWQIELHSRLASARNIGSGPIGMAELTRPAHPAFGPRRLKAAWMLASVVIASCLWVTVYLAMSHRRSDVTIVSDPATGAHSSSASAAGIIPANVSFAWALNAPVIVGTGRADPLPLGAYVPYDQYGHTLHVWNWTRGETSRVYPDVRLFESARFAVHPEGTLLVTSQGKIIRLSTGEVTQLDLGDEFYSNQGDNLRRIQGLEFTPDGGRLALLVTNIELAPPSHPLARHDVKFVPEIQVLRFPEGRLLSAFPPGHGTALRFAFSANGDRVVAGTPADEVKQQIVERETDTGRVIRTYEPVVEGHAYVLAYSPNGQKLAVYDGAGALLLWDTRTGALLHRIESVRTESPATALRFSPDSRHLAVNAVQKSFVVDVASGQIVATLPQVGAAHFLWSDDGARLTIVTGENYYEGNGASLYNHYPAVFEWNWKDAKLIRSHDSAIPAAESKKEE